MTNVWTTETAGLLFNSLMKKYVPHAKWETKEVPKKSEAKEYAKWCKAFTDTIGAGDGGVKFMIAHATGGKFVGQRAFVFASSAALDAGFITNKEFDLYWGKIVKKMAHSRMRMFKDAA
jgi:hypothetical protein